MNLGSEGAVVGYSVAGKRVLVTGASAGIGAAVAVELARAGAIVGICARRADRLAAVLAECQALSPGSMSWVMDLSQLDEILPFAQRVQQEFGPLDVLINNAGIPKRRHIRDLSVREVDEVMTINYLSPVRLTLAVLPGMIQRGEGRIVNVSSIAARLGPPREAAYCASKAAISAFSESMSVDLDGTGVKVHIVNPGIIDTELFHLPDNEASLADLPAEPASALAEAMLHQLSDGPFELFFPGWFAEVAAGKATDAGAFLAGTAQWVAQREQQLAEQTAGGRAAPGGAG